MQAPDTQSSMMAPLGAQSHLPLSIKISHISHRKLETLLKTSPLVPKTTQKTKSQDIEKNEEEGFQDGESEDSSYEYSEDIMSINPRNQTRKQKERGRLSILLTFDWMRQTSQSLKLTRQVMYRSLLILRKFLLLEKKNEKKNLNSNITVSNIRFYGLASLLISNKIENIDGNFLGGKSVIVNGQTGIEKQKIISCEKDILKTLRFLIPVNSLITENLIRIIQKWNLFAERLKFNYLNLGHKSIAHPQSENPEKMSFMEVFLHLVDYVFLRKITGISSKDFQQIDNSFYEPSLVNILFNLGYYYTKQFKKGPDHHKFRQFFSQFVFKCNPEPSKRNLYCRQSHNLLKQIKRLFGYSSHRETKQIENEPSKRQNEEICEQIQRIDSLETSITPTTLKHHKQVDEQVEREYDVVESELPLNSSRLPEAEDSSKSNDKSPQECKVDEIQRTPPIFLSQQFQIRKTIDNQKYLPIVLEKLSKFRMNNVTKTESK